MKKIKIVIADDHAIVREGLRAVFAGQTDMEVIAEASDGDEALTAVVQHRPHVLLLDLTMPGCTGQQLIAKVTRRAPTTAILIVSMHREEQYAAPMIRAGARGFVSKTRAPKELVDAARKVAAGEVFISSELAQRIALTAFSGARAGAEHERLSAREQEVLTALARGQNVTYIAERLYLSPKTVSTHKARIFHKLGVENISELVRYALNHDLL